MSPRFRPALRCAVALSLLSHGAQAELGGPCFSNAECDEGFICSTNASSEAKPSIREPQEATDPASRDLESATDGGASVDGGEAPEADAALPELPAVDLGGNCVPDLEPCTEDADCEAGYHCELHGTGSNTRSCDESGTCNASEAGEGAWLCAPDELTCKVDSDCPEPTVCYESECVYELNTCAEDSDCDPRYVCGSSKNESCRSDADDGSDACEDLIRMCFPPPIECESDDECDGWQCHPVPQGGNPPIGWEELDKACMPPGLVALIEDRIEARGDALGEAQGGATSSAPPDAGSMQSNQEERAPAVDGKDADGASTDPDDAEDETHADEESEENADDNGADESNEGCNVAAGNASRATWLPVLFALALLHSRRTTRRRTQRRALPL